ncbi:MAG: hypothetical protein Q4E36_02145 [Bacillota bacterium]|nr:hypothetical protein [Bacillota bacterium]
MTKRLIKLFLGLIMFGLGLSFVYFANIGLDSWNSLHSAISNFTGIPIGYVSVIVAGGAFFLAVALGEKFGLGTIADSLIVGPVFQFIIDSNVFEMQTEVLPSLVYISLGMAITALGALLYMSSGFGAGPRDSMYLGLSKKFGLQVGTTKLICEVLVVVLAYFLGGLVGWGTFLNAIFSGLFLQAFIFILKFDPKKVDQENIFQSIENFRKLKKS